MTNIVSSLLIVISLSTYRQPEWKGVVEALQTKHADMRCRVLTAGPSVLDAKLGIQELKPRYVAFVMEEKDVSRDTVKALRKMMRELDDDPFEDAIWGIVSGPDAATAKRIASSNEPKEIRNILSTTGVGKDLAPGIISQLSDANPPPPPMILDTTGEFRKGWNTDPELIVTSSHATERNLEMPFSRGNLLPDNGKFKVTSNLPLKAPTHEKVWIAPGNCLIANHKPGEHTMVMTALGWGKCNQFVGYIIETWFGEIGWDTWKYFANYRYPMNESYYFANQFLLKKLSEFKGAKSDQEYRGMVWDRDGTAFWGDPAQRIKLADKELTALADLPFGIVFPDAKPGRKLLSAPEGYEVFVADDFALLLKAPAPIPPNWRALLTFTP